MTTPGDFNSQLADLTVKLVGMVAERLAYWTKDIDSAEQRRRVLGMIEDQLPTVISNAIAKSPSLHSNEGVKYLEANLDAWADSFAKKFIGKD